ncbi:MAG: phosphatase PAP2 family protein [Thiobacillaceae bacterium]|jgi:undecaprenyl-diphosphatase|nr:phosphatase PAP2 family protein [Thiobacillaceae bacterium]
MDPGAAALSGSRARPGILAALPFWLVALVVLAAGAGWVCPQGQCGMDGFDRAGLVLAHDWRVPALDAWMGGVTWFGSLFLLLPLAALLAWRFVRLGRRIEAAFVLLSLLGAAALSHLTKLWVARPRPELHATGVPLPWDWSYPSAHAMQAAALALALCLVAARPGRAWAVTLVGVALLVGLSRVYLQVHYPSDVLVGMLAALFWVLGLRAWLSPRPAGT